MSNDEQNHNFYSTGSKENSNYKFGNCLINDLGEVAR